MSHSIPPSPDTGTLGDVVNSPSKNRQSEKAFVPKGTSQTLNFSKGLKLSEGRAGFTVKRLHSVSLLAEQANLPPLLHVLCVSPSFTHGVCDWSASGQTLRRGAGSRGDYWREAEPDLG